MTPLDNPEIHTLFGNIDLLLRNCEKIVQNEKYKNIFIKGTGIDDIYIGHIDLLLGDLITLWQNNQWRNEHKFYYHLGGSSLSGMSFCTYWLNGKIGCDKNKPSFGKLLKPAYMVLKNFAEQSSHITLSLSKQARSDLNINDLIDIFKKT